MDTIVTLISNLGFPIFVCIYFMFRTEKILKQNTQALVELRGCIKDKI